MVSLIEAFLLRFIAPDKLPRPCWRIDVTDTSLWVTHYKFVIGEDSQRLLCSLSAEDQSKAIVAMKAFFITGVQRLQKYLPFENEILRTSKMLSPHIHDHKNLEKMAVRLARAFPSVFAEDNLPYLQVEIRVLQAAQDHANPPSIPSENASVSQFWAALSASGKYPFLSKLARALFVLPHGNADVERVFSVLGDIILKKRSSMDSHTIKALVVSRSCMEAKCWTAASLPVSQKLLDLAASARASSEQRKKFHKEEEEKKRRAEMEKLLAQEVVLQKKQNKALANLEKQEKDAAEELEKKLNERKRALKIIEEMQSIATKAEEDIEEIRKKKERLLKRSQDENIKVVDNVLKRHCANLTSSSSIPPPKKQL
jgi:hypothetical protein